MDKTSRKSHEQWLDPYLLTKILHRISLLRLDSGEATSFAAPEAGTLDDHSNIFLLGRSVSLLPLSALFSHLASEAK